VHLLLTASFVAFILTVVAVVGMVASARLTGHAAACMLGCLVLCAGFLALGFRLEEWSEALIEDTTRALGNR
jgi:membrane-bound ClpP family serine protease